MIRVVMAITAILGMGATAMADRVRFDAGASGSAPAGWTQAKTGRGDPKWTVEEDPTAPSKSKLVKQSGRATYPLLLKNGTNLKDGFIEVQFKALSGSEDRAAGLVWRAKDADNCYVVRANALEDNVVLYKTVNGVRSSLDIVGRKGGYGVNVPGPGQAVESPPRRVQRESFQGALQRQTAARGRGCSLQRRWHVGLWTKADSVTLFDEITYGETN